ncbi:MOSC domain-containing protein [Alteromonas halophila]|uniref:Molybdenum cofactor sulfurase n=1 Tax=Alteromonas halophila TaxID=516698 RepID=A0A918JK28_9ALTE|nr:MOSC domain-containing protein [Alteromonas halophila]GGW83661.1 molybdenum cofactor sulfurase [Alteromonas halophila]
MNIHSLFAGKPAPFGPRGAPSSIIKHPVSSIRVHKTHTDEDEQGNKKLHGGPEKVLHQYSLQGYELLNDHFPHGAFAPGSIGENLLVAEMTDNNVYIGDIYQIGKVQVQVCAPRAPCNKISQRYDIRNLDRFVAEHGITGWYYRVIQTGTLFEMDEVIRISRPDTTLSVATLTKGLKLKDADIARQGEALAELDPEWRQKCARVIAAAS